MRSRARVPIAIGSSENPFCFQIFFYHGKKIVALRQAQDKLQARHLQTKRTDKFAAFCSLGARPNKE
jgi:hypothetical protein